MKNIIKYILVASLSISILSGCSKPAISSDKLKQTVVTPVLEEKITDKNILYCSTFQMAWNELKNSIIKDNIALDKALPIVDSLNKEEATKDDVSKDSVVAMAGFGKDDIVAKINKELKDKFGGQAPTVDEKLNPDDILAYSYLYKNLEFKYPFEKLEDPIRFGIDKNAPNIKAFGIKKYEKDKHANIGSQVTVIDYKSDEDFIIKLKSKDDDIVLAKINPAKSLKNAVNQVEGRMKSGKEENLKDYDVLKVPCIDFDIRHSYKKLEGRSLKNKGFGGYIIAKAFQNTKFKLNENGATIKSEAKIEMTLGVELVGKNLVFDKPFIVILKEKNAKQPYFVLWVNNAELLD